MSTKKYQKGKNYSVGERIRIIRGGLNQTEFGKILGVEAPSISRYESGRVPDITVLEKIAAFGKTTIGWILEGEGATETQSPKPGGLMARLSKVPLLRTQDAERQPAGDDDLLYDIVVMVDRRLLERRLELTPEDKGVIIVHLHQLHRKLAIPVSQQTVDSHIDLRAGPRQAQ